MSQDPLKFNIPGRVYFGAGSVANVTDLVRQKDARNVFVVTDGNVVKAGLLERLMRHLEPTRARVKVYDQTEPEPTVSSVQGASDALKATKRIDAIISLGGGSVMDVAKCANVVYMNGGEVLDYEDGAKRTRKVRRLLPHWAVPTTAGTGSEATMWAVFIDPERRFKTAIQDPGLIADAAILDPDMTRTMPARVAAATGLDALTHAIEAYVSIHANMMTDALCAMAISLISGNLRQAVRSRGAEDARTNMLLASFMGGAAFSNSSLGIAHTLAEGLGGYYRIPHGVTNALILPHVMRFNLSARPAKFANISRLMGTRVADTDRWGAARRSVESVRRLCDDVGLPGRLRDVGVRKDDLDCIIEIADRWANLSGNPKPISRKQIRALYDAAF